MYTSSISHRCCVTQASLSAWIENPRRVWCRINIMNLFFFCFLQFPNYLLPLRPYIFLSTILSNSLGLRSCSVTEAKFHIRNITGDILVAWMVKIFKMCHYLPFSSLLSVSDLIGLNGVPFILKYIFLMPV